MRILAYSDTDSWLEQLSGLAGKLGAAGCAVVTSSVLAGKASRLFEKTYYADLKTFDPAAISMLVREALERCSADVFLAPCSIKGRVVAGFAAAFLRDGQPVSDVMDASMEGGELLVKRLVFGGSAVAELRVRLPAILCLSPGAVSEAGHTGETGGSVERLEVAPPTGIQVEFKARETRGVEPDEADVVVVAGRGFKKKEDLEMVKELARLLKGAWSVTRPLAADYGWSDTWIGISGLSISPRLYIGIGVSGQPHHMMGVRGSKIIVAVNKDPNAPIFEEADYGIVGDLYKVLPVLVEKLKRREG